MDKETAEQNAKPIIARGMAVETLMTSNGWEIWTELLNKKLAEACDIYKITTIKELDGAKKAKRIITDALKELESYIHEAHSQADFINTIK